MTSQQVYDRFKALYQEKSSRYFDTVWAIEILNDAVDDIRAEALVVNPEFFGLKTGTISYVIDQQEYDLPSDFIKLDQVYVTDRGGPPYPHLRELEYWQKDYVASPEIIALDFLAGAGRGEPYYYYVRGQSPATAANKMGLVPIPSRAGTNNLIIQYHAAAVEVTAIDTNQKPDLPTDWHPLVPYRMCVLAAVTDSNASAQAYTGMYNSRLEKKLMEATRGRGESAEEIHMLEP